MCYRRICAKEEEETTRQRPDNKTKTLTMSGMIVLGPREEKLGTPGAPETFAASLFYIYA